MLTKWFARRRATKKVALVQKLNIERAGLVAELKALQPMFVAGAEIYSCYVDQRIKVHKRIGQIDKQLDYLV